MLETESSLNSTYIEELKQLHQQILKEKEEELEYIKKLVSAQQNLSKQIEDENNNLKSDLQKIENEKGQALQTLANLGG